MDDEEITQVDMDRLRHAVGMHDGAPADKWGYRNFYCSPLKGEVKESMMRLHRAELVMLMRERKNYTYFQVTRAGCERVGLNEHQTARALDGA